MATLTDKGYTEPKLAKESLTLRDYFAAKLICSFIEKAAHGTRFGQGEFTTNIKFANAAYSMADAMLEARKNA